MRYVDDYLEGRTCASPYVKASRIDATFDATADFTVPPASPSEAATR